MSGTVRIIAVRFRECDVYEGAVPPSAYEDATTTVFDCDTPDEAIGVIQQHGLDFASTGRDWAANPDGSTIVNYATGEREALTAHLDGFTSSETSGIMTAVG